MEPHTTSAKGRTPYLFPSRGEYEKPLVPEKIVRVCTRRRRGDASLQSWSSHTFTPPAQVIRAGITFVTSRCTEKGTLREQ